MIKLFYIICFFFSSRRRHTRCSRDWSSDVCSSDLLDDAAAFLQEHVPELKVGRAHGQMASRQLDAVMNAFYDRQYDVLLSTSIVESGLDIPTANTLIVHRSDMF